MAHFIQAVRLDYDNFLNFRSVNQPKFCQRIFWQNVIRDEKMLSAFIMPANDRVHI